MCVFAKRIVASMARGDIGRVAFWTLFLVWTAVGVGRLPAAEARALRGSVSRATVDRFSLKDLGGLKLREDTYATGLNSRGQVVGYACAKDGACHAFVYSGAKIRDLGAAGREYSSTECISDSGDILGWSADLDGPRIGFLWSAGKLQPLRCRWKGGVAYGLNCSGLVVGSMLAGAGARHACLCSSGTTQDLGTLGGNRSTARAISEAALVVGDAALKNGDVHAFLWIKGTMTDLGTLGGRGSTAYAVNGLGQVAGEADSKDELPHAFLWSSGVMRDLGCIGGHPAGSTAYGVNARGQVVGQALFYVTGKRNPASHGMLWQSGRAFDLNVLLDSSGLGWTVEVANGINDAGQIAATAYNVRSQHRRAVLLTPVACRRRRA